jgi:hypothetical protein
MKYCLSSVQRNLVDLIFVPTTCYLDSGSLKRRGMMRVIECVSSVDPLFQYPARLEL